MTTPALRVHIVERATFAAGVRVWPIGACSAGSKGESLAEIAAMKKAGIVAVSDDGKPVASAKLMRQVMDYCGSLGLPVIDHCEDVSLAAGAVMREGETSVRLGLAECPPQRNPFAWDATRKLPRSPAASAHRASFRESFSRISCATQKNADSP